MGLGVSVERDCLFVGRQHNQDPEGLARADHRRCLEAVSCRVDGEQFIFDVMQLHQFWLFLRRVKKHFDRLENVAAKFVPGACLREDGFAELFHFWQ